MKDPELRMYLRRIGMPEEMTGSLETLKKLHLVHPKHITFENIDTFTGNIPSLNIEAIFNKLVKEKRGGYCYEQNSLFRAVLQTLGFRVKMHLARVLWSSKDGSENARSHMMLTTDIMGEKYLVDVGFGSVTLTAPVLFNSHQDTPNGMFRLISLNNNFHRLDVFKNGWLPIYKFSLEEVELPDIEMANWYMATGPDSVFNRFLIITRVDENARYSLFNKEFNISYNDGNKESREITSKEDLKSVLINEFNLDLSEKLTEQIYTKISEIQSSFEVNH